MVRKIAVITATRAEYGLLSPLMKKILDDPDLELQVIVTGAHLSPEFGLTWKEIEEDGFPIHKRVRDAALRRFNRCGDQIPRFGHHWFCRRP